MVIGSDLIVVDFAGAIWCEWPQKLFTDIVVGFVFTVTSVKHKTVLRYALGLVDSD